MKRRECLAAVAMLFAVAPALAQDPARGEAVFKRCRACHAIGPAALNKAGPALTGIVGRRAASAPGFNYSDAMQEAGNGGLVWTEAKLAEFIEAPDVFVPDNVMASPGIKNPSERADLIAFLKLHK
ncbi:MAG: cytochrome c family protein [Hyphomicrobium sp.]